MKVLFICRPNIGLSKGGLQGQIYRTARFLEKKGIEVIFHDPWKNQIKDVDICHCWSSDPHMIYHVKEAKKARVPVVISPVFMRFLEPLTKVRLEYGLARLIPGLFTPQKIQTDMFRACDKIIALNTEEKRVLEKTFQIPGKRLAVIPNGIDQKFSNGDAELFKNKFGVDEFVLQVGYIEPRKNALTTITAMKDLPYKLVLVGGWEMRDEQYVSKCKDQAGDNVIFTGHINYTDPLITSAYRAAKVFVLPSFSEVMPLVVYEAAQAGCKLVLSNTYPCSEVISDHVFFANPHRPSQFRRQIKTAMEGPRDKDLQAKAMSMPSWEDISDQIKKNYTSLLS